MESNKVIHRRKPDIPVIDQKSAHRSQQHQMNVENLDLCKVIRLFENPLTANLTERHLFMLSKLLKKKQIGFLLKELTSISRILNVCAEKAEDHPEYVPLLCEAIKLCRLPFLKEKSSDELNYAQDVVEFLRDFGCLMRVSHADVRQLLIECVKSFYSCVAPKELLDGVQPTSPSFRLQLLEHSDLAQTLLLSLAIVKHQPAVKLQLLQTLQILSSSSDMNCASMVHVRGAEAVCLHMNEADPSGQVLLHSIEILWNFLERGDKEEVTAQLCSLECVVALKEAFLNKLLAGSLSLDPQIRNDLLGITTLIADRPNALLIESLFAKQIVVLAIFPESKSHHPLVRNLQFTFNNEDLKMKKLLLNLLVLMSSDCGALQLYRDERVVPALLTLAQPPPTTLPKSRSAARRWSALQQEELQLQALATLNTVAPLMLDDYMSCQGNACLLLLLDWCIGPDPYFGQGHSFHATGGRGTKKAHMRHCIRVMRSITSLEEESVNQDLCDQGIVSQLLGILTQMEGSPHDDDMVILEMEADIQLILSTLCEPDMHRKELFGSEGVEMTVHFLKKGCEWFYGGLGHNKLVLSTVDCVWSCIIGCYTTEDYFLAKDGAFLLLDLLSVSPRCVHGILSATLLELLDNPSTAAHLLSWRGIDDLTAPRLLLQLWREEEEELGVSRNQNGGIEDPQRPVLSRLRLDDVEPSFPADSPGAAVLEVSENLRSKIYFMFCTLGFQDLPGLSTKDYVTLTIIRRYLDFKVGEVWDEVSEELRADGVKPIRPDEEALNTICKIAEDKARRMLEEQNRILEHQWKKEISKEELLYTEIKFHRKQQELEAKSWDSYVSKTSNYEILKEVKAQRENQRNSSRSPRKPKDVARRPVENFIGQMVAVQSTDGPGPAGVKVMLGKTLIRSPGQDREAPTTRDPEYFSTVSVKN